MPGSGRTGHRWGWHCLSGEWATRIVAATPVRRGDLVLDLGAGDGALTAPLVRAGARVLAVEMHAGRAATLRRRFARQPVTVLEMPISDVRLPNRPFRVVANPPFQAGNDVVRALVRADRLLSADIVLQTGAARGLLDRERPRRHRLELGAAVPGWAFTPPPSVRTHVLQVRRRS